MFLAGTAFFFSAVAGYIAGVVGSSNSPVSGMTIATLMGTALLVIIVGDLVLGMQQDELMFATLIIASVVAVNAAIAGDVMQDLKTGHLGGATPWKQQIAEIVGVITGAVMAPLTLVVLNDAYRITNTYCEANPIKFYSDGSANCSSALDAPQAEIIGTLIQGIFGGTVNFPMLGLGVLIAVLIIWKNLPGWKLLGNIIELPIVKIIVHYAYVAFAKQRFKRYAHCQLASKNLIKNKTHQI